MAADVDIVIEDAEVRRMLDRLAQQIGDLTPIMRKVAGELADVPERALRDEQDPATGEAWEPLTIETLQQRAELGYTGPILQRTGQLAASVQSDWGRDYASVGSNLIYAAIHQFGGLPGMPPGPAAVPARPYLGVSQDLIEDVSAILLDAVTAAGAGNA